MNGKAVVFLKGPQSALEVAIRANDMPGIQHALAAGASANAIGKQQITPLMIAVDVQAQNAVAALLGAKADPNARAADGNSPVSLAVENYETKPNGRGILLDLMHGGGDPNARRPDDDPVVMCFLNDHALDDLRMFKSLGADLDILDRERQPLITGVAMAQDWDVVWCMIELGTKYDYEHGESTQPLSQSLSLNFPAPDSPLYPYKLKVWQLLKDKGLPVKPLRH